MNRGAPSTLGRALRGFFADHLPRVRGASPHTIQSYRDAFVLLLKFVAAQRRRPVSDLDLADLGPQEILNFLQYLEMDRHSVPATRNVRLAAIHAFFRYCAAEHPDQLNLCQRVLAVPFKRARSRPIEYLEFDEIQAVLTAIDRTTADGRRDYALLATMFNTGARVQEIITLRILDVRFQTPPHVRLFGKGRKERICPLWPQTAEILCALLAESGDKPLSDDPLFRNHRGSRLTRFGVRYILRKHCARAQAVRPALANKRLHPHSMRHSTAVHLLRSGVDILTISQWLGHATVTTTNRYATIDLEMKRKAIEQAQAIEHTTDDGAALWRTDASILTWLEAL
ncbi:MAG TPA: site-specific integrase [Bryobacteraceae bacterium]|nr:site-specific integrase [Bryobacteraceae bacterium]